MISGIITRLLADASVQTAVGVNTTGSYKIYPVVAEQSEIRPYVTLRRLGAAPTVVKNETSGKDEILFNVAAYAETYKECVDILAAVRTSIDNFKGTSNGIEFLNVWYTGSEDLFDKEDSTYVIADTYTARMKR